MFNVFNTYREFHRTLQNLHGAYTGTNPFSCKIDLKNKSELKISGHKGRLERDGRTEASHCNQSAPGKLRTTALLS